VAESVQQRGGGGGAHFEIERKRGAAISVEARGYWGLGRVLPLTRVRGSVVYKPPQRGPGGTMAANDFSIL